VPTAATVPRPRWVGSATYRDNLYIDSRGYYYSIKLVADRKRLHNTSRSYIIRRVQNLYLIKDVKLYFFLFSFNIKFIY